MAQPKIILYTSHQCPWAHRAHIALRELGVPYEEVLIDLSKPRTPEYLAINSRGLVPSISYNGHIITESAIVSQFLVDAHPSHLLKSSGEEGGALQRARINFFVDTWFTKISPTYFPVLKAKGEEKEEAAAKVVDAVVKEIEPLLADAGPFFGGSGRLTFAEVLTGSFIIRLLGFSKYPELVPASLPAGLEAKAPNFWKWASAVVKEESVTYIWDEKAYAEATIKRLATL
ncbi:hypothetical protein HYALB_00007534 [Hymenoscyphus albidus]|uniref:Thioredoxin-like protein n=1 Tax=Hymenoscyphus albidus TaxID=595503 RepID=A0A9N9Q613_9HELO|nr:hypothetical protein HYALB_00007534 [Hymenoscyphus albidus]